MSREYNAEELKAWEVNDEDEADGNFVLALSPSQPSPQVHRLFDRVRVPVRAYIPGVSISLTCNHPIP